MMTGSNHDRRSNNVLLTLVSKSDRNGLVTQCTLTDLMDFASIQRNEEIQDILQELERRGLLSVSRTGVRKREFQLLGSYERLRPQAMEFLKNNSTRVAEIQNQRSKNNSNTRSLRDSMHGRPARIEILDLEKVPMLPNQPHQRWRFTVNVDGKVAITDCILIEYPKPYIAGPNKGPIENRESYVRFPDETKRLIVEAMLPHMTVKPKQTATKT